MSTEARSLFHAPGRASKYRYDQGCRCAECREAKNAFGRQSRARRKAENRPSYQRELETNRALKERYRGVCRECGAATTGCNGPGTAPELCVRCKARETAVSRRGTGEVNSIALAFLTEPRRFMEIAAHLGVSKGYVSGLLYRLRRYGLVERLERGVYRKVAA